MIETNLFPVLNLSDLQASFSLYRVKGLRADQPEYHQNCQHLRRLISHEIGTRYPIEILKRSDGPFVAIESSAPVPSEMFALIRGQAALEREDETIAVDFSALSDETRRLGLRVLQSAIHIGLQTDRRLWVAGSGGLYFEKDPAQVSRGIGIHRGFLVRAVPTADGGLGICVDIRGKYIDTRPLEVNLSRRDRGRIGMKTYVYRYGHNWYEIQVDEVSEFSVQQYLCTESQAKTSLLDWIFQHCPRPHPKELTTLDPEGAVVEYATREGDRRGAPAQLCYQVFDTQAPAVRREHQRSIMPPHVRRREIAQVVHSYLSRIRLAQTPVRFGNKPIRLHNNCCPVPDLRFGGNQRLTVNGSVGATKTDIPSLGKARLRLLEASNAGFFTVDPLYRQHLFLPASVQGSWGSVFVEDLKHAVNRLYPQPRGYDPKLIIYDDRRATNYVQHCQAILEATESAKLKGGYAVVMLADRSRIPGREDQLAAAVTQKLHDHDLVAATIHASSAQEFYELDRRANRYVPRRQQSGRARGYLRNVALNKVLLTSTKWPFVLDTPLHADLIVGIDVKGNTAGFTIANQTSEFIFMRTAKSRQKEKLLAEQCRQYLVQGIKDISQQAGTIPKKIVIHRDGRLFDSEQSGIAQALVDLKRAGVVASDAQVTCLEIPKKSFTSVRLFAAERNGNRLFVTNPEIGYFVLLDADNGYLCTTGNSFLRRGTVQPLHIRRVSGDMSIEDCLADVFALACLTWSQPEGCARHPITLRLNDRQLVEDATPFNEDAFEYAAPHEGESHG